MENDNHGRRRASGMVKWAFLGFALIAGYFLFTEHRAHLYGALPYILLLLCPLMHLLHHRGHGRHRAGGQTDGSSEHPH